MNAPRRVYSECGSRILEVAKTEGGLYTLKEFARRYDTEEKAAYEIKVQSNISSSKFGDFETALQEAERLVSL